MRKVIIFIAGLILLFPSCAGLEPMNPGNGSPFAGDFAAYNRLLEAQESQLRLIGTAEYEGIFLLVLENSAETSEKDSEDDFVQDLYSAVAFFGNDELDARGIIWLFADTARGFDPDNGTIRFAVSKLYYFADKDALTFWEENPPLNDAFWSRELRSYVVVDSFEIILPPVIDQHFLMDLIENKPMPQLEFRKPFTGDPVF